MKVFVTIIQTISSLVFGFFLCITFDIPVVGGYQITTITTVSAMLSLTFIVMLVCTIWNVIDSPHPEETKKLSVAIYVDTIGSAAEKIIKVTEIFDGLREKCEHHTCNTLTGAHNCYEGKTQSECNPILCPLKRKGY